MLPGGKIRLAGSRRQSAAKTITVKESVDKRRRRKVRHSSWHGPTHDMTDFFLDDYEVIGHDAVEQTTMSDIESVSTSDTSQQNHYDSHSSQSSDDGIEIDITERLKEYNVISLADVISYNWDQQLSLYE